MTAIDHEHLRRVNRRLNCFLELVPAGEFRGVHGPLEDRTLAVKANVAVTGFAQSAGLETRRNHRATRDAACVRKLREAGAVVVGTTNMDEGALGAVTDNPHFGACDNPRRSGYTAGGSSGGSAAAVAADLCRLAVGTDTLGSVRIPASYCGVVGFKPGHGVVDIEGVVPVCARLDHVGLLAGTVGDLTVPFDVLDTRDGVDANEAEARDPRSVTVGVLGTLPDCVVDTDVSDRFGIAVDAIGELVAGTVALDADRHDTRPLRRAAFLMAERGLLDVLGAELAANREAFSERLLGYLDYAASCDREVCMTAERAVNETAATVLDWFDVCDVVMTPTTPQSAFARGEPVPVNQADFTVLANVSGLPAVSVPMTASGDGMPAGVQFIGGIGSERSLLGLAAAFEELRDATATPD